MLVAISEIGWGRGEWGVAAAVEEGEGSGYFLRVGRGREVYEEDEEEGWWEAFCMCVREGSFLVKDLLGEEVFDFG